MSYIYLCYNEHVALSMSHTCFCYTGDAALSTSRCLILPRGCCFTWSQSTQKKQTYILVDNGSKNIRELMRDPKPFSFLHLLLLLLLLLLFFSYKINK